MLIYNKRSFELNRKYVYTIKRITTFRVPTLGSRELLELQSGLNEAKDAKLVDKLGILTKNCIDHSIS